MPYFASKWFANDVSKTTNTLAVHQAIKNIKRPCNSEPWSKIVDLFKTMSSEIQTDY